jgi:predicted pyridoxine 5'-phosphate oxidase superfamily flavin-nucleotide-binding protein
MPKFFEALSPDQIDFIKAQPMFFVASAAKESRVNCSPKGTDTFRVLNDRTVAYLDITGSGNETSAHIVNGGRVTIMFCSFGEKPKILRMYGKGEVVHRGTSMWSELSPQFSQAAGQRQIIVLHVETVQTSCGFGVPKMQFVEHRDMMDQWATKKGEKGLVEYRAQKNRISIDGLPTGLPSENA